MMLLPDEIILYILARLPAKSLARFKCVSKFWCQSIRDPKFIKSHLSEAIEGDRVNLFLATESHSTQTHLYCFQGNSLNQPAEIETPIHLGIRNSFDDQHRLRRSYDLRILGTCNGLVCLGRGTDICLLNPCTREYKTVKLEKLSIGFTYEDDYEDDDDYDDYEDEGFCSIGSDDDGVRYGLGYDDINDDYKLVEFVNGDFGSEINFYSLNDASCTTIVGTLYEVLSEDEVSGIYLNGCLHWVAAVGDDSPFSVISINVSEEVVREFPLLEYMSEDPDMILGVLGGQLCVFCDIDSSQTEIWAMKSYGVADSWVNLFSIEKIALSGLPPLRPLGFSENGKVVLKAHFELVIYDPKTRTVEEHIYPVIQSGQIYKIVSHLASLIPLKSSTYLGTVSGAESSKKQKGLALW